ncbi:hexose transporter [Xylaria bambusicola]|uniref:hexose transporter n=1 Tax=Xylaria bambusicola TaxID=326684 RepID=UPI0020083FC3|nr:hexose transporter [Xylaria bambusicola]KAI0521279.1 hexose transporter [Xylaria bambusicola]
MKDSSIVGEALAQVMPRTNKYWFQQPHLLKLNLLLLMPLLSSSVAGYDGSLMNGLQSLEQWQTYFGSPSGATLGLVNAAQAIGSVLALPFVGVLTDKFGRKPSLFLGLAIIIVATIIQATSFNLSQFIIARAIVGFGGMFSVHPSPLLIAELAYPTHRGKYTSAFWTMYYLGAILASWTTFGCQNYQSTWAWRIPSILQAGFPIIQLIFFYWVPESPRWLVSKDRTVEATEILSRYHAPDQGPGESPLVRYQLEQIVQTLRQEKIASSAGWSALISTPGNRKRTLIAFLVGFMAQWNGVAVVSYYLTLVLRTIGITSTYTQTLINGLLQVFNFASALGAAFLVDRLGRRTLFLWSGVGMLVSYIILTACSAVVSISGNQSAGIVVVVTLFTFFFHYDIAYTPLLFGYPTEVLPFNIRGKGLTVELFGIYGSLTLVSFVNPIGLENIGWKYYLVFSVLLVIFLGITYFLFPETKGHTLEEIAVLFDGPQVLGGDLGKASSKDPSSDIQHYEGV